MPTPKIAAVNNCGFEGDAVGEGVGELFEDEIGVGEGDAMAVTGWD